MLLPTVFLSLFALSVSNLLPFTYEKTLLSNVGEIENSTPSNVVNSSQKFEKPNASSIESNHANLNEPSNILSLQAQLKALDKKINKLQKTIEEQYNYANKLTALEFTLNHVLSKVIYLTDNLQPMSPKPTEPTKVINAQAGQPEILSRLGQLLRHVQNIERDNCRRSSIPAAAGPILSQKPANLIRTSFSINEQDNKNFYYIEELLRKLEQRLNSLSKFTNLGAELKQLPVLIKQNGAQLTRILEFVSQSGNEDTQQQSWQNMLEYCQGLSDEFSTFAGSSDALLKRIESIAQDTKLRIESLDRDEFDKNTKMKPCHSEGSIKHANETLENNINEQNSIDDERKVVKKKQHFEVIQVSNKTGCHDLEPEINKDGIYAFGAKDLNEIGRDFNQRFCTFATDERAWTVVQHRGPYEVQENFNRSWIDYRNGFGDLNKDFWFGNEFMHRLTYFNNYELLVELENFEGGKMSISYGTFGLDSERVNYNLFVGDYKGPGPDALSYHNFMDFSTFDRRNDKSVDDCCPCANGYGSGWWFDNCLEANLNGIYRSTPNDHKYVGIIWEHWLGDYSLKATRMLIRPKNYINNTHGDP